MTTLLGHQQGERITLSIPEAEDGQVDSVIPLRWCLSRDATKELARVGVKQPYLLIVIENNGREMERYVISAWQLMRYIQFRRPGRNVVHATIVWGEKNLSKMLLERNHDGEYSTRVLRARYPHAEDVLKPRLVQHEEELRGLVQTLDQARAHRREAKNNSEHSAQLESNVAELIDSLVTAHNEAAVLPDSDQFAHHCAQLETLRELLSTGDPTVLGDKDDPELVQSRDDLNSKIKLLKAEIGEIESGEPSEYVLSEHLSWVVDGQLGNEAQLEVVVPADMFAKQPSQIVRWLAGIYRWERRPRDQCNMRRRALITLATLPFFVVGGAAILAANAIVATVLLLGGMRNINFSPFRHPYIEGPWRQWEDLDPSYWYKEKKPYHDGTEGYWFDDRPVIWQFVNPPVILAFGFTVSAVNVAYGLFDAWVVFLLAVLIPLALVLTGYAATVTVRLLGNLAGVVGRSLRRLFRRSNRGVQDLAELQRKREAEEAARIVQLRAVEAARQRARDELEKRLSELSCSAGSQEASLAALPKQRRTIVLRYEVIKARVCKPFAQ